MGNHHLRLVAVALTLAVSQAFTPRIPSFLKPSSPQFLYLGEEIDSFPVGNKGGTNVKREFITPPPIADDEALHRSLLKARLDMENRATKTFDERPDVPTRTSNVDESFQRSLLEARLRMENRASYDARVTLLTSEDDEVDGNKESGGDIGDDVFSSELNLKFEAILKNLDEALKDIHDELEATASSVPVDREREEPRESVKMSKGPVSSDDEDDDDYDDNHDCSPNVYVGSKLGETVDLIMKSNDKKAHAVNASPALRLRGKNPDISAVTAFDECDDSDMKIIEQSPDYGLSKSEKDVPTQSVTKENNHAKLRQAGGATMCDPDALRRSFLAARLDIEPREKKQNDFNAALSTTVIADVSPPSTNMSKFTKHSLAAAKGTGTTSTARPSYAFQCSLLEARLAMIAKEKERVPFSDELKVSDHRQTNQLLPVQDESDTAARRTYVIRRGTKSLANEMKTIGVNSRRTHVIQKGNQNGRAKSVDTMDGVPWSNGEFDAQNQAVAATETESLPNTSTQLTVSRKFEPSDDVTDTLGLVLTHLTKATVSGGRAVFLTFGAMLEAAGNSEVIQSTKAVKSSMSKVAHSLSSLVNETSTVDKTPGSSDVLRGFQSTLTSLSAVCETFFLSFQHSSHSKEAYMAATDSLAACRSVMAFILALGLRQEFR